MPSVKKTKLVFFIYRLGGGGAARTMLNIVNNINKDKYEPILVTLNFEYDYDQFVDPDVTFVKLKTKRLRKAIFELANYLREEKPDLLFSTVLTYNIVAALAVKLSRTKVKLVVREAALLRGESKGERLKIRIARRLYNQSAAVVALSQGVKDNLINYYRTKENLVHVIYNPVDLDHIEAERLEKVEAELVQVRKQYESVIVSAGRFVKEKDQITLLRAFAKVRQRNNACLILLGEGELEDRLKEEAERLNLADSVHFIGFRQNPYAIFNLADIFALTSTTEGFGHVLVEALATETLVVSTDCKPGAREVLVNGEYGFLAEVGDPNQVASQIEKAIHLSHEEKEKMIEKGLIRANEFNAKEIVSQYEELFDYVLL